MKTNSYTNRTGLFVRACLVLALSILACSLSGRAAAPDDAENPPVTDVTAAPLEISPINLAVNALATASGAVDAHPAADALDGDTDTYWEPDGDSPQYIEVDLGVPMDISSLSLTVYQSAAGQTTHRIYGKGPWAEDEYVLLHEFSGATADGDVLTHSPASTWSGIEFIKVETVDSVGASGWREILLLPPVQDFEQDISVDLDEDGVPDFQDWCPESPGPPESNGC